MIRKRADEFMIFSRSIEIWWTIIALFSRSLSATGIQHHNGTQPSLPSVIESSTRENQSWFGVRKETSHLYVDKTEYLERLLSNEYGAPYFFLTRPPGFGKSVFLDMIEHFLRGHKHLFEGSQIYKKGNAAFFYRNKLDSKGRKWVEYPVIRLNFGENAFADIDTEEDFEKTYYRMLGNVAKSYSLDEQYSFHSLSQLIRCLHRKFNLPVVLLIDEFDGLMEYVVGVKKNRELAQKLTRWLGTVLSNIKHEHTDFLTLITAVSRFEHDSGHGGALNVYSDITYDDDFETAFGFTAEEIEANFKPYFIDRLNPQSDKSVNKTIESSIGEMKERCGIYNFPHNFLKSENMAQKNEVMNPLSVIECLMRRKFTNRTYLTRDSLDRIVRRFHSEQRSPDEFENGVDVNLEILCRRKLVWRSFNEPREYKIDDVPLKLEMLLYGYLTIKTFNPPPQPWPYPQKNVVTLKYPNKEIKEVLNRRFASYVPSMDDFITNLVNWTDILSSNLKSGDIEATMNKLEKYGYPYMRWPMTLNSWDVKRRLFTFLKSTPGIDCDQSITFETADTGNETGVIDLVTRNLHVDLVIKVKKDGSALEGIEELFKYLIHYPDSFRKAINNPKKAYFVGINFQSKDGGKLAEWIAVPYTDGALRFNEAKASPTALLKGDEYLNIIRTKKDE